MYDSGKVITGLLIFVAVFTFPFWFNVGNAAFEKPELKEVPKEKGEACVEATEFMTREHMQLLNEWRDWVVRDADRIYVNTNGEEFAISLQNTCMDCHTSKKDFCDKCHDAAAVTPYCWTCHIEPKESE